MQGQSPEPSRRDFLAISAAGFLGLPMGAGLARAQPQRASELLYVGTYTDDDRAEGIHLVRFDSTSGELRLAASVRAGPNPSFLALHPKGDVLYAVNEVATYDGKASGAVVALAIDRDTGGLTRLNEQPSAGGAPCYVSVDRDGRALFVANYLGGNIALLPIRPGGALAPASHVVQHRGKGPNASRQEGPHAHCILGDPSNRFVLAADLGVDRVLLYRMNIDDGTLQHVDGSDGVMRPGAGPRHLEFHPKLPLVFVANELDSTVTALRFDSTRGTLSTLQTRSTLPAGWTGDNYPADIHVAPDGRALYVSNRGHNSIAVFTLSDSATLSLDQVISTGGDWPRNFSLDPSGRWLLVAHQRSGSIVVFARDQSSGRLTPTSQRLELPRPVCLRFSIAR